MNSTECPSCAAAVSPGTRWCAVCRSHLTDSEARPLASPGRRLEAAVVDAVILLDAFLLISLTVSSFGLSAPTDAVLDALAGLAMLAAVVAMIAYVAWVVDLLTKGMTPGKFGLGLQVVGKDGSHARLPRMLVREWFGKPMSAALGFLGYLVIPFARDKQGMHDMMTSTFVVEARRPTKWFRLSFLGINAVLVGVMLLPPLTSPNREPVAVAPQAPAYAASLGDTVTVNMARLFRDPDGDRLTYVARTSDLSVAGGSTRGSILRVVAAGAGTARLTVTATDPAGSSAAVAIPLTVAVVPPPTVTVVAPTAGSSVSVCDRTPPVRDEIVRVTGAASCDALTEQDLAGITGLNITGSNPDYETNALTLSGGALAGLSGLETLDVYGSRVTLMEGVLDGLASLRSLSLRANALTLPEGVFGSLSSLRSLSLRADDVTLSGAVFAGLSGLRSLDLSGGGLTTLPEGLFANLPRLERLDLTGNPGSPFPLALRFEQTDGGATSSRIASVRLTIPEGAPFAVTVPLSVAGGVLSVSSASLAAGSTAGSEFKITQTSPGRAVRLMAGRMPAIPDGFTGITLSPPAPLELFGGAERDH